MTMIVTTSVAAARMPKTMRTISRMSVRVESVSRATQPF